MTRYIRTTTIEEVVEDDGEDDLTLELRPNERGDDDEDDDLGEVVFVEAVNAADEDEDAIDEDEDEDED